MFLTGNSFDATMTTGEEPTIPTMVKSDILYRASLRSIGLTTVPGSIRMSVYPSALACATAAAALIPAAPGLFSGTTEFPPSILLNC